MMQEWGWPKAQSEIMDAGYRLQRLAERSVSDDVFDEVCFVRWDIDEMVGQQFENILFREVDKGVG